MNLNVIDVSFFLGFFALVVSFSMYKSRREKSSEDYFLASRGLLWPLIGLSIVAANISTEQFVGMAGQGAGSVGLAVSNWQLVGTVGIVIIAFTLLPRFLRAGIYTMPEFLEYRYNAAARSIMALLTVIIYVTVLLTAVLYSGGLTLRTIFGLDLRTSVWLIGIIAALYTTWGGLKAVAWADLFQGLGLLVGGIITFYLGLKASGGWTEFSTANADKLHMILPADDPWLPWTGVASGMWIVIIYYCGLNQFIVQRNLAAKTLRHGQLGVIFAGALWVIVPFAIVMPGIMANTLHRTELAEEADKVNEAVLAAFTEAQAASPSEGGPLTVFNMDDEWVGRFPGKAAEIKTYNERVTSAAAEGRTMAQQNLVGFKYDAAFPVLITRLIPNGLRGLMFAFIAGAVISSLASMLNSSSTILTMDIYNRLIARDASQKRLVMLGRAATMVFVLIGCLMAPALDNPAFGGVFQFIQQFQGYIWPGVVAAFVVGFILKKAPGAAGVTALVGGPAIYGLFQWLAGAGIIQLHFLIQVALTFVILCVLMGVITMLAPLREPKVLPVRPDIEAHTETPVKIAGALVIAAVVVFYVVFW